MQLGFRRYLEKHPNNPSPKYSVVSFINTCTLIISYDPSYHLAGKQERPISLILHLGELSLCKVKG